MRYKNYSELTSSLMSRIKKVPFAIVCANEAHTMDAVAESYNKGIIEPHFIGDSDIIRQMLSERNMDASAFEIIHQTDVNEAAQTAVSLVHNHTVRGLMKGKLDTGELMRVVLKSSNGLRTSSVVSAMSLMEVPHYHKLIAGSDPALCITPSLDDKIAIISNAVSALNNLGIDCPKVAILAAAEKINPKMPETIDAIELKKLNQTGIITDCVIDGPLSYDLCMDPDAAKIKGINSPVAGDPDLIIYPNVVTGNAVSKALVLSAGAVGSSIILGTSVPVVLPSRAASVEEKFRNILLACASI